MVDEQARYKIGRAINSTAKVLSDVFCGIVEVLVEVLILDFDWTRLLLFIAFLVSLGAVFLPVVKPVRIFAGIVAALIAIYNFRRDHEKGISNAGFPLQGTKQ